MIDMFGGSGGFTTEYINHLNENYPQLINWATEINKISHFDMNEDVIKSAGLEFFCLTGALPNMNNLKYKNSFTDEFAGAKNEEMKYHYVFTNPPYGGDKITKTEAQNKREKVKEYIKKELLTVEDEGLRIRRQKQLKKIESEEKQEKKEQDKTKVTVGSCSARIQKFAKTNGLKGNDKESCSLMLMMDILAVGGTAVGVLKEGVFFNKTYKELRKCLIENYNVREVISVPQDQFENTKTKTSIIIFDNTEEKTSEVKFSELVVERFTEDKFAEIYGDIVVIENKDAIKGVSDVLISQATREEILGNHDCSLDGKNYHKKEIAVGEGYSLVKLGDICEFIKKSKRNASFGNSTGQYNFYTSSEKVQRCDVADYSEECLIIGSGGVANIKMDANFSCSADNILLKSEYNHYLYSFLKGNIKMLSDGFTGSTLKHLSKDYIKNLQIPIPKSKAKIQEWVDNISLQYDAKQTKQTQIKELETIIQNRIREIGEQVDCEERSILELTKMLPNGKHNTSFGKSAGKYKFYNSSNEEKLFCDKYEIENESIIIGFKGNINIHFGRKFTASQHMYVLQLNDATRINSGNIIKYLYNYLKNNENLFTERMHGTTIKHITKNDLNNIKIKIPKNKQIIDELDSTFQQIEALQEEVKIADELYSQLIKELTQEALPCNILEEPVTLQPSIVETEIVEPAIETVSTQQTSVSKKKAVKKIVKKSKPSTAIVIEDQEEQPL